MKTTFPPSFFHSPFSVLSLLYHTLRYLKPVQIFGRIFFKIYTPRPDTRPAPALRPGHDKWTPSILKPLSLLKGKPLTFRFLGIEQTIETAADWNHQRRNKLWLYHLHYFDDLNAVEAAQREVWHRELLARWQRENPPGKGNGWEPYPLSLRIVNWIKWHLTGHLLESENLHSLAVQIRFLRRRLEYHLLGNHLFVNAKALIFGGIFFQGRESEEWLKTGLAILEREIAEQILSDGGHFERSPMYHSLILEDMLDLLNLFSAYFPEETPRSEWQNKAMAMLRWLQILSHPDGQISFFNDATFCLAAPPTELARYAQRLGLPALVADFPAVVHLAESGYLRLQQGAMVCLLDAAPIGADYQPGHAHADTLSFELSWFGQRLLVNSGISAYAASVERLYQRSSAAHNTVVIDGKDSSEVWHSFRVARRAKPFGLEINADALTLNPSPHGRGTFNDRLTVQCSHDGYQRLYGKPVHQRRWQLTPQQLTITDTIYGEFKIAQAYFHFHPSAQVEQAGALTGKVYLPAGQEIHWRFSGGTVTLTRGVYYPAFGSQLSNDCLVITLRGKELNSYFQFHPLTKGN